MKALLLNKFGTLTITTFVSLISILPLTSQANAYAKHEHAFYKLGSNYSQNAGNCLCRSIHNTSNKMLIVKQKAIKNGKMITTTKLIPSTYKAWDKVDIRFPKHIWYHQNDGNCIANTSN
jgi:hypothetical protein